MFGASTFYEIPEPLQPFYWKRNKEKGERREKKEEKKEERKSKKKRRRKRIKII